MCLISNDYKFILFNFPKTGSTSIREILDPYANIKGIPGNFNTKLTSINPFYSHIPPIITKKIFKINKQIDFKYKYDDYYKFCFVRNPWARIYSLYKMKKGKVSFGEFINHLDMYKYQTKQKCLKYGAYSLKDWIYDKNGKMLVDKVFKLENFDEFLDKMKEMGIHINSIPILNQRTNVNEYRKHYNKEMKTIIEKRFKYEIDNFNYTF